MPTVYMVSALTIPYLQPEWMEARVLLMTAAFCIGISMSFVGPFYTDESLPVMCIALFFNGCLLGPLIIPNMGEMMAATELEYPEGVDLEHANSLLSGMLNSAYGAGGAIGPLLGSGIYQVLGFRSMCDIVCGIAFTFALTYFLVCNGSEAFKTTCRNRRQPNR